MMSRKQTLASDVLAALEANKLSLATAESCTGGGVGQALTAVPGSSRVYRGGIISYTNEVKSGLLHVPETLLRDLGAVSGPVAEAMEKLKREQLAPILSQWRDLLTIALTCRSGLPEPDPLGKALASSRTSRELSQGVAVLDRSLIFLQGNVSPGAVCGDLVWQLQ